MESLLNHKIMQCRKIQGFSIIVQYIPNVCVCVCVWGGGGGVMVGKICIFLRTLFDQKYSTHIVNNYYNLK